MEFKQLIVYILIMLFVLFSINMIINTIEIRNLKDKIKRSGE